MKKLFLIPIVALLTSCLSYSPIVNFVDYSAYNKAGMFLTESNSVNFDYSPIGSIQVLLYSSYDDTQQVSSKSDKKSDDIYSRTTQKVSYQSATSQNAISVAVDEARKRGANAIINLKYEYIPARKNTPEGWVVSGMAVKK